jgi:hypothetical protein
MADTKQHIIAIDTYGSHRVKNPHTGQIVSAYKMGYSSAASAVLLALYGNQARDVSSKHASYHYIQIDVAVTVRHGHILLKITDEERVKVEALTRQVQRPAVYCWQDNIWMEFPKLRVTEYAAMIGHSGPNFNPTDMLIISAATGEAEAAVSGIIVEISQRDADDEPWYWLRGETFPHRDLLKRWGCRWSKKRKAWRYTGWQLPEAVQNLVNELNAKTPEEDFEPVSDEAAGAYCSESGPVEAAAQISDLQQQLDDLLDKIANICSRQQNVKNLASSSMRIACFRYLKLR